MTNLDRILAAADAEMQWRIAACMHRARKDAARALLLNEQTLLDRERPLAIARRYLRFLAHLRRSRSFH